MYRAACILLTLTAAVVSSAAEVPRRAPEFAFQLSNGKQVLLSGYRGKVVIMEFLFTTCPHCQHSAQLLSKLQKEYGPRGFQPLGVAFNDMASMLVPEFVKQTQASFPIGFSPRESVLNFLQHPTILRFVVPQMVLIDRKGFIRGQTPGEGDDKFYEEKSLREKIEALLKESATVSPAKPAARKKSS